VLRLAHSRRGLYNPSVRFTNPLALFLLLCAACAPHPVVNPVFPGSNAAADSLAALSLFRENIDAIHKRDSARYLATYLQSPRLVRNGPQGPDFGYDDWAARRNSTWPDTLIATDLTVVPIASDVVYGTYRYDVRYGDSTSTGISERVFLRTPAGWRIAVTTAFGTDLRYVPRNDR
jgi:hypothetical protein